MGISLTGVQSHIRVLKSCMSLLICNIARFWILYPFASLSHCMRESRNENLQGSCLTDVFWGGACLHKSIKQKLLKNYLLTFEPGFINIKRVMDIYHWKYPTLNFLWCICICWQHTAPNTLKPTRLICTLW